MLVLTYKMPPRNMADPCTPRELTWTVGDTSLKDQIRDIEVAAKPKGSNPWGEDAEPKATILSIRANGPEMVHIADSFSGLPCHRADTLWNGYLAQFIFDNLI